MDSSNNNNNNNSDRAKIYDALMVWVGSDLQLKGISEGNMNSVEKALHRLRLRERDDISETMLTTALVRVRPPEDTQADVFVEELAELANASVQRFNTLAKVELNAFYENARLPKSLLETEGLTDYIEAAEKSGNQATELLDFLTDMQDFDHSKKVPNLFVCIIASSGTGKTQLAATASLTYDSAIATTIYLNMGRGESQPFYKPHIAAVGPAKFKRALSEFFDKLRDLFVDKINAHTIEAWAAHNDNGNSLFVRILYHLLTGESFLFPEESRGPCVKLIDVRKRIKGKKFHVFLDEVPAKTDSDFDFALCLRDTLRYLSIAPILMSTHTGAQDYVGATSRTSIDTWTWVVSTLPRYAPFSTSSKPILVGTERPLVQAFARNNPGRLQDVVRGLQAMLQSRKPYPWEGDPALQLVQLFCTDVDINGKSFASTHNLVGHHFGCLQQSSTDGRKQYGYLAAANFVNNLSVAPVCAATEPLLYLALVTWDEGMLWVEENQQATPQIKFPLVDNKERALTVRAAFDICSGLFISKASTENAKAEKADGKLMEVLVHASITLASMKICHDDGKYLAGVCLKEFLPLVRKLMLPGHMEKLPPTPELFNKLDYEWVNVPALGGSNSCLPSELAKATGLDFGYLERPADKAMVDGTISYHIYHDTNCEKEPFISVECKNYSDGVGAHELMKIFKHIKSGIKCSLIFVSHIELGTFERTTLASLKKACFSENHSADSVSIVAWDKDKDPAFLKVKGEEFKAKKTTLLVLVFSIGLIDANISRKRKRMSPICTNV